MDRATSDVIAVLERFCAAFADRDADALMRLVGPAADLVVITSEESLLRGPQEFEAFLRRYEEGPPTYSWDWDRYDVSIAGPTAWILAEGTETEASGNHIDRHPYRMTMVLERDEDDWRVRQAHGSSPH
jgi:ketosteroid isomerase-like protein